MSTLTKSPAWQALERHRDRLATTTLRQLFADENDRFERFSLRAGPLLLDCSKNWMTAETLDLLVSLARQQQLPSWIERLFSGYHVNHTEGRAALHMALRNRSERPMSVDGKDVMPAVRDVLGRMRRFSAGVREGRLRGATGKAFRTVVNIGIGGSDLGPCMVCEALRAYAADAPDVRFVSNVDDSHLMEALRGASPEETLFIVSSKTFTTQETMANAESARQWLTGALGNDAVGLHFAAVSTNVPGTTAFGISPDRVFEFWDWVGGRYSLWSAIGLPVAMAVGMDRFEELLAGAHAMDEHFRTTSLHANAPVMLGLLDVWYADFHGCGTRAVLPYSQYLHRLPAYLQQLDMESNGKQIDREGNRVDHPTGAIVWGEPGTNGQHAFFQLLHQGTQIVPCDFIVAAVGAHESGRHHEMLLANCLAQTQALAFGKSGDEAQDEMLAAGMPAERASFLSPYRSFPGNRPSTTILLERLDPYALGALIALYEHRVFVQSVLWNINAFDQWGVELGKQLAGNLLPRISGRDADEGLDGSTAGLLHAIRKIRSSRGPASR
ncbi:MAG: glucose-6-phosphate isomerase [Betaproteobacteria bacterium]|nr:glucose-6-phosphate isomerase [Betaproteobacteria bacterium]